MSAMTSWLRGDALWKLEASGDPEHIQELQQCCSKIQADREDFSDAMRTMDQLDALIAWVRDTEDGQSLTSNTICDALSSILMASSKPRTPPSARRHQHAGKPPEHSAGVQQGTQTTSDGEAQKTRSRATAFEEELNPAKSAQAALAIALQTVARSIQASTDAADQTSRTALNHEDLQAKHLRREQNGESEEAEDVRATMIAALKDLAAQSRAAGDEHPPGKMVQGPASEEGSRSFEEENVSGGQSNHRLDMAAWLAKPDPEPVVQLRSGQSPMDSLPKTQFERPEHQQNTTWLDAEKKETKPCTKLSLGSPCKWQPTRSPERSPRGHKPPIGMTYVEMLSELALPYMTENVKGCTPPESKRLESDVGQEPNNDIEEPSLAISQLDEQLEPQQESNLADACDFSCPSGAAPRSPAKSPNGNGILDAGLVIEDPQTEFDTQASTPQNTGTQGGGSEASPASSNLEEMVQEYLHRQHRGTSVGRSISPRRLQREKVGRTCRDRCTSEDRVLHSPQRQWVPTIEMLRSAAPKPGNTYAQQHLARVQAGAVLTCLLSPQRVFDSNQDSRNNLAIKTILDNEHKDRANSEPRKKGDKLSGSSPTCAGLLYPAMQWHRAVDSSAKAGHPSPGGPALAITNDWGVTIPNPKKASQAKHQDLLAEGSLELKRSLSAPELKLSVPQPASGTAEQPVSIENGAVTDKYPNIVGGPLRLEDRGIQEEPSANNLRVKLFHDEESINGTLADGEQLDQAGSGSNHPLAAPNGGLEVKIEVFCNSEDSRQLSLLRSFFSKWKCASGWASPAATVLREVRHARKAVEDMARSELAALRVYTHPPSAVRSTLEALAIVLSKGCIPKTWGQVLSVVRSEGLKAELLSFRPALLAGDAACLLQARYLSMPSFTVSEVSNANHALGPLLLWVKSMATFSLYRMGRRTSPTPSTAKAELDLYPAAFPSTPMGFIKAPLLDSASRGRRARKPSLTSTAAQEWEEKLGLWRSELAAGIIMGAKAAFEGLPADRIQQSPASSTFKAAALIAASKPSPVASPELTRIIIKAKPQ